jgi:hypothetical protein
MEKNKVPVTIKTEEKEPWEMPTPMKVALALVGGCFAWLLGLVIGKLIIAAVFAESAALLIIWGIVLFIALAVAVGFYIDDIA